MNTEHAVADDASILVEVHSAPPRERAPIHDEMTDKSLIVNSVVVIVNEASVIIAEMIRVSGSKVKYLALRAWGRSKVFDESIICSSFHLTY